MQQGLLSELDEHLAAKLTLLGLTLVGGDSMSASGQGGREQDVVGGRLVVRVSKAGVSAPAAQWLIGKCALKSSSGRLEGKSDKDQNCFNNFIKVRIQPDRLVVLSVSLTGSLCGISPGLSMIISFFRSSSIVLLYVRRGERRSLSDARSRGCPKTFFAFVSTCLEVQDSSSHGSVS